MDIDNDEAAWLERVLTAEIPLGGAMGVRVVRLDETGIELALPLAPNRNDKGTAFGGALASAMILAGWSLPRLLLRRAGIRADLVIGRCETRYLRPVSGAFRAVCDWPQPDERRRFIDKLERQGRGSVLLAPRLLAEGEVAATLEAKYAGIVN